MVQILNIAERVCTNGGDRARDNGVLAAGNQSVGGRFDNRIAAVGGIIHRVGP